MITPKASGKRVVRVRKWWLWHGTGDYSVFAADIKGNSTAPCFVITNPPPGLTAAKLKKLVEIAANWTDGDTRYLSLRAGTTIKSAERILAALGLAQPKARKRGAR
jgi:hypothetical protein